MIQVKDMNAEGPFVVETGRALSGYPEYLRVSGSVVEFASAALAERALHESQTEKALVENRWTILPKTQMVDQAKMPPSCPECGAPAAAISVGTMTTIKRGLDARLFGPTPGSERIECANGHFYLRDGTLAGPPQDITIDERGWL